MSRPLLRAVAAVLCVQVAAWACATPLSLDQAADLAVQRSQTTRAARAGALGAAEMAAAAGQQPDPMLTFGIDNLPVTGPNRFNSGAEDMTMRRIGVSQEWVGAEKRAAREAAAGAVHRRERTTERVAAAEVRLQTAIAYVDAFFASRAVALSMSNEMHAREELAAAQGRLSTISGSSAEVLGLSSALGRAEDESADQHQQEGAAFASLARWIGAPVGELAEPQLRGAPAQAEYVASHPTVLARQRDIEVARQEVEVARLNRKPNWTYEVSYGQRRDRSDLVTVGVSIPLPVAPAARQDRESAARLAVVEKAEADLAEAQRAASGEFAVLVNDARRLQERVERYRTAVLKPLAQRTEATLAAYRANQASLMALFESRHAELDAERRLLVLQRDLARVQVQLVFKPVVQGAES